MYGIEDASGNVDVWNSGELFGAIDVALIVLIIGGFLGVTMKTGAMNAGIAWVVSKLKGKEKWMFPILMTPTSAVVMGGLAIARVGYGVWLKFVPVVLILLMLLSILVLSLGRAGLTTMQKSIYFHKEMQLMAFNLRNRSFLKELDFTPEELKFLLKLSADLKAAKYGGYEQPRLKGKNIALIFEKASTRTRCAFEVAAYDQGAHVTYLGPSGSQIGNKESMKDTARVLGRMYDGIEYRGFAQDDWSRSWPKYAGVPVWNGLTDEFHPTQMLADFLTMMEHSDKPLRQDRLLLPGRRPQQHGQLADGDGLQDGHGRAHLLAAQPVAGRGAGRHLPRRSPPRPARA